MRKIISMISVITLCIALLTSCGEESTLACVCDSDKEMSAEAVNANEDDYCITGSLEVEEGEKICVTPDLEQGKINFEFIASEGEDDMEELPDADAEAVMAVEAVADQIQTIEIAPGSYRVKVTCMEDGTTGSVTIQVQAGDSAASEDLGSSEIYTEEDMASAVELIKKEFSGWKGCELHSITYAGDECNSEENIKWMNELKDGQNYTQCIEFLTDFHSPVSEEDIKDTAWEQDKEYEGYQWYLARTDGGDWDLLNWGY